MSEKETITFSYCKKCQYAYETLGGDQYKSYCWRISEKKTYYIYSIEDIPDFCPYKLEIVLERNRDGSY